MATQETDRYLANWQDEMNGAMLYQALADAEPDPKLAEVYRRLAATERKHAEAWAARLQAAQVPVPPFRPAWRVRALAWLARRFGPGLVLPSIAGLEQKDSGKYNGQGDAPEMAADEQSHARLLSQITRASPGGMEGATLARLEGRHRATGGNALRAAVLGASDGLLSNLSLVMGVAGAELAGNTILITGLAGLLAGASSMALGEWLSVQSSRELYEHQIKTEKAEIAANPEEEADELALIYQSRGLDEPQARAMATQIMSDQANALETLAREELGLDPKELGGSAWEAAITSFLLFATGAAIPVIPFVVLKGMPAVAVAIVLSMAGLFLIGAAITLFTGRSILYSGLRQMLFGLVAAAITYGVGRLIGVSLAG